MKQVVALQQVVAKESSGFVKGVLEAAVALSPTSDIAKMVLQMLVAVPSSLRLKAVPSSGSWQSTIFLLMVELAERIATNIRTNTAARWSPSQERR
jgi:hypothetical protein